MRRDVIAMGASAGGIEALRAVVSAFPSNFPASVLIVQHIAAGSPGWVPIILQRATKMPVCWPRNGERAASGCIYVAPPDRHLLLEDGGIFYLGQGPKENRARPAIDPLFRSVALAYRSRVIGVVLTGYLDDGAAGLAAIKLCGGIAIVQDPGDAMVKDMPTNALAAVAVDHCLPLAQIGPCLTKLVSEEIPDPKSSAADTESMAIEAAIAAGRPPPAELVARLGEPSRLTCPDCKGMLMRMKGAKPHRYRCHTGHAYSQETLRASIKDSRENAVWAAVRALQEEGMLLHHMARHAQEAGDASQAAGLVEEAEKALIAAGEIRDANDQL